MSAPVPQAAAPRPPRHPSLWIRELPFVVLLVLTILGVAYTSFSKKPLVLYWELLAPLIGVACVATGWRSAGAKAERSRLVLTQTLHWLAFLVVMNLLLLPSVQRVFTADSTGLAVFTLLALGTFTAGVHIFSWQICLLGLIMALCVPALAWVENSALLVGLAAVAALALVVVSWRHWREKRQRSDGGDDGRRE